LESINNIEVFASKDAAGGKVKKKSRIKQALGLESNDEEEKVPAEAPKKKTRGRPKKPKLFEGSAESANSSSIHSQSASGSRSNTPASQSPSDDELVTFDYNEEMLFVGLIDSVRDETSYNQLMINLRTSADRYKTDFWEEHKIKPEKPARPMRPKTAEEVKTTLALLDEINEVLNNEQYTDNVFYRPRKDTSCEFVDNIEQISGQLIVQNQPVEDVAKYYKMSKANMKELVRHYLVRSGDRMRGFSKRIDNKESNEKLIADELKKYLNSRAGMYTTVRMMRDYLRTYFSSRADQLNAADNDTGFKLNMINCARITKILKKRMNYRYKKSFTRPPQSFDPIFIEHRALFPVTTERLDMLGYNFIYIDEASVASDNLSTRSWQIKGESHPLVRPGGERINVIAAYILKGKYAFMLKRGSTTSEHVAYFIDMLHEVLIKTYGAGYLKHTIFIMDNAKVHVSNASKKHFRVKGYPILTLPPYTPEYNRVENTFNLLKMVLKKKNLYKKRLEYVVAHAILEL